jgi:polyphosphate kinase 2 (PPK2 family)
MKLEQRFSSSNHKLKLAKRDPDTPPALPTKSVAMRRSPENPRLAKCRRCWRSNQYAVLVVLQALVPGKGRHHPPRHDGPQSAGLRVTSFSSQRQEADHDFLWSITQCPDAAKSGSSTARTTRTCWWRACTNWFEGGVTRYDQINEFEEILAENNTIILKFFLHITKDEQKRRLEQRMQDPMKNWKISEADFAERRYWDDYMAAYEDALSKCSTKRSPWYVIPANKKWFRNLAVSQIIVDRMKALKMEYPPLKVDLSKLRIE